MSSVWGRDGRAGAVRLLVLAALLLVALGAGAAPGAAQSATTAPAREVPPRAAGLADALPRAEQAVQVRRNGRTFDAQPLKSTTTADDREALAGRIIVAFWPETAAADRVDVHRRAAAGGVPGARAVAELDAAAELVDAAGAASLEDALRVYRADRRVRYAEPDYLVRADFWPDDTYFGEQWSLKRIEAPEAWDVSRSAPSRRIAILDCGMYVAGATRRGPGHPDLNGKVDLSRDFTGSPYGADDQCGHGTHVAGTAGAGTNNGAWLAGAGFDAHLLNAKVLDDTGTGATTTLVSGIRWAADNGASVINLSLGRRGPCSSAEQEAIDYAWARNAVVVAAAGNDASTEPYSPASCAHVLSVASSDPNDKRASYSNHGGWVTIAAPGDAILSTSNSGGYQQLSGTSMAAPHVSGVAALVWTSSFGTSNQAVVDRIVGTADRVAGTGADWQAGRLNAASAVGARSGAPTAPSYPVASAPRAWGMNDYHQVAADTTGLCPHYPTDRCSATALQIPQPLGARALAAGGRQTLAVGPDGRAWTWGGAPRGDGADMTSWTPFRMPYPTDVVGVSAGAQHQLLLRADGTVWSWGWNFDGQLGTGDQDMRRAPTLVDGLAGVRAVSAGGDYSLALEQDGTVWSWGDNSLGQLGSGAPPADRAAPAPVVGLTDVVSVEAGAAHALALRRDGTVWRWGVIGVDALNVPVITLPAPIVGLAGVKAVSAGFGHDLALMADGTVRAWGANDQGQLGDGTAVDRPSPVPVVGLSGIEAISAGNLHNLALGADGQVWAWGFNRDGQVGDGTISNRPTPVRVSGLTGMGTIAAGPYHSLAAQGERAPPAPPPTAPDARRLFVPFASRPPRA